MHQNYTSPGGIDITHDIMTRYKVCFTLAITLMLLTTTIVGGEASGAEKKHKITRMSDFSTTTEDVTDDLLYYRSSPGIRFSASRLGWISPFTVGGGYSSSIATYETSKYYIYDIEFYLYFSNAHPVLTFKLKDSEEVDNFIRFCIEPDGSSKTKVIFTDKVPEGGNGKTRWKEVSCIGEFQRVHIVIRETPSKIDGQRRDITLTIGDTTIISQVKLKTQLSTGKIDTRAWDVLLFSVSGSSGFLVVDDIAFNGGKAMFGYNPFIIVISAAAFGGVVAYVYVFKKPPSSRILSGRRRIT